MLNNYYTLVHLAMEFAGQLRGAKILQAATRVKQTFEILFETKDLSLVKVVVSCLPSDNFLYMVRMSDRTPSEDPFGKKYGGKKLKGANVFPEIVTEVVNEIAVVPNERQLYIEFSDQNFLRINLFGSAANAYFTDIDGTVINSFLKPSEKIGKRLPVLSNLVGFPENVSELSSRYSNVSGNMARRLSKCIPTVDSTLAGEISYRYYSSYGNPEDHDQIDFKLLDELLTKVKEELMNPSPRIYFLGEKSDKDDMKPVTFGLIELKHLESEEFKRYESVNECIRDFKINSDRSKRLYETKADALEKLRRKINSLHKTLMKMDSDLENASEEKYLRFGQYVMSHLVEIKRGDTSIIVEGSGTEIKLEPALTPARNAQTYFEKAKYARVSKQQIEKRKSEITKELRETEILLDQIGQRETSLLNPLRKNGIQSRSILEDGEKRSPFREFEKSGYKIFVGKDAKNNDKLTFGFAKPNDIFLHVRGASGSHVIIRNSSREFPQRPVIQFAAGIAAHYSKARSSGIVPVAYTMRKFVKKAKGQSGAVLLDREEVIFVKPGISK